MPVLYRKYRPQRFSEVVGQKPIITTLQNQIKQGQVSHAYLFVGSRGIGKTSVARILAKAVNCESANQLISQSANQEPSLSLVNSGHLPQEGEKNIVQALPDAKGEACGECEVCKAIEQGNLIDLIEIDAASNTGVDNIRELIDHVRFVPAKTKYKVFIIDEVHMLSKGAFNALLKTLEEPPAHAIFILATTEVGKVPATIISRTQRFDFKRVDRELIEQYLLDILKKENLTVSKDALKLIAVNSEGGLRDALSLLDKALTLGTNAETGEILKLIGITDFAQLEQFMDLIVKHQTGELPKFLSSLSEQGTDFIVFNKDFLEYLRKLLVLKISRNIQLSGLLEEQLGKAEQFAENLTEIQIINFMRLFLRSLKEQATAPSSDLPVLLAGVESTLKKTDSKSESQQPKILAKAGEPTAGPVVSVLTSQNPQPVVKNFISETNNLVQVLEGNLTQAEVESKWGVVSEKLREVNGPLANLIRLSQIERVMPGKIVIGVKYKFHKQNLDQIKNQEIMSKVLWDVFGQKFVIGSELKMHTESDLAQVGVGNLADAIKIFGGELID